MIEAWTLVLVVVNGLAQVVAFVVLIRGQRETARMARALAGLIYQEEEKTWARIDEALRAR